ncbi:tRNA glutamyl-Q synthetase [Hydrogenophaga crassostreae]|uniref:Glutamyl-Q tRNA(Asp) synthetase n=1 Tax=Hydrogenophaga crassostreae TaxID=1763535 RepID=A0A162VTF5_9BURK|nr:tRNA glutamyl-Q(34) synthetase GluQRS [Hydrogenophaga crassostreae]AOW15499.1 tRNA glutamyl-Q(34) synthetase GluQRS [Hydrogenophaga crassostreae]OAD40286.1 tRNA glutamyl-Q synthetase [Hydrogenophaga crassostreae]
MAYRGRFAPSPTGPLHAGSLVAALASWLDAKAQGGTWLVRIEDVDTPRCIPGADQTILQQLAACGLISDEPVIWQSQRSALYQSALDHLIEGGQVYPCACSRKDIEAALSAQGVQTERHQAAVYPGTCRPGRGGLQGRPARAWRFAVPSPSEVIWQDQQLGEQRQHVADEVGDFVLKRADGLWAYQLAVVVDDAAQGITHVVRGQDLADNTPRQILLQQALALPTPAYRHTPLVLGHNGEKLSKQNQATPLDTTQPLQSLNQAARLLNLPKCTGTVSAALTRWVQAWRRALQAHEGSVQG